MTEYRPQLHRIEIDAGRFQIVPPGTGFFAEVLPVLDASGDMIDRIAWRLGDRRQFWTERGTATWLGEEDAEYHRWAMVSPHVITICETPGDWFHSLAPALCVLDWTPPLDYHILESFEMVRCATPELGHRLAEAIKRAQRPTFRITAPHNETPKGEEPTRAGQRHDRAAGGKTDRTRVAVEPRNRNIDNWL